MRTHTLELKTRARTEFVPLKERIAHEAKTLLSGSGILFVYVPHTTAGVCVNEGYDPDVVSDMSRVLDRLAPWDSPDYRHSEGNTAAHVKAALIGASVTVPVREGTIRLGRWQEIFFCEFDGPRTRTVELQFLTG